MNDFFRRAFENARILGFNQYVFTDTNIKVYNNEIKDKKISVFRFEYKIKILISEKQEFFDGKKISFWNLYDIAFNLTKSEFFDIMEHISKMICKGSEVIFDYPIYSDDERQGYLYGEIENMLEKCVFLIYEFENISQNSAFCAAVKDKQYV